VFAFAHKNYMFLRPNDFSFQILQYDGII